MITPFMLGYEIRKNMALAGKDAEQIVEYNRADMSAEDHFLELAGPAHEEYVEGYMSALEVEEPDLYLFATDEARIPFPVLGYTAMRW